MPMPDEKASIDALVEFVIVVLEELKRAMPQAFELAVDRFELMIALLKPFMILITSRFPYMQVPLLFVILQEFVPFRKKE